MIDRRTVLCGFVTTCAPALARRPRLFTNPALDAAMVIDALSGKVLYARNASAPRHPASLTKLMTLYLLFERMRAGKLMLQTELPVSPYAASQPRAHLRLKAGTTITVEKAIEAMIVRSANDAAVVVAEAIGGNEAVFATMMNAKAHALGMTHTFYSNATGLPDEAQLTTADDIVLLARRLIYDFPQYFPYFATRSMTFQGRQYETYNALLIDYPGVDGMKTGYVDASGYSLVTTVHRGNTHVIAVLMGGITPERRNEAMVRLLDDVLARAD